MIRRPPRSTLFPTRRSSDLRPWTQPALRSTRTDLPQMLRRPQSLLGPRSEEHTSELQSRLHLVCRLLLEKKKSPPSSHAKTVFGIAIPSPDRPRQEL